MRFSYKQSVVKALLLFVALVSAKAAQADNRLEIAPVTFLDYETVQVPVTLDNTDPVASFQFDVALPDCLEFAGEPVKNLDRLSQNGHQIAFRAATGRVMVISRNREAVMGNSGTVLTLPVRVKPGQLDNSAHTIKVRHITMSDAAGTETWSQPAFDVTATLQASRIIASADAPSMVFAPGRSRMVNVSMTNNCNIDAFQLDVVLPEGFTIEGEIELGSRCSNTAYIDVVPQADGRTTRLIMSDLMTNHAVNGNEGVVFSMNVKAPFDFMAETAEITVNNFQVSYAAGASVHGEGFTMTVVNSQQSYSLALARVTALENALEAALETIATEAPDVKDNFPGDALATRISDLKAAVNTAYEDYTIIDSYNSLMETADGIAADIEALVAQAKEAEAAFKAEEKRKADNLAAYNAVLAEIEALQASLNTAAANVAELYPHASVTAEKEAAQNAINAAKTAADNAYASVAAEGVFAYTVNKTEIEALIAAMTAKAQAEEEAYQAEEQRKADNLTAYNAVVAELNALQASLDAVAANVAEQYPHANVTAEKEAAQNAINTAKADAEAAYEAVAAEGEFNYTLDKAAIEALIAAVTAKAQADEAAYENEETRKAANEAAYQAVVNQLNALSEQLDQTAAAAVETYPHADVTEEVAAARDAIAAALAAADADKAATADEGLFSYTVDSEAIEALINAVTTGAAADEAEYEDNLRREANRAAHEANVKIIDALEQKLIATEAAVAVTYPDADVTAEEQAARDAIAAAREAEQAAYDAVADEGVYDYTVDSAAIEALIDAIVEKAKKSGISEIEMDALNGDIMLFNLQGTRVVNPSKTAVYIMVDKQGNTRKVVIK